MSEWIDFGIYVVQLLLLCVFLPRQGSRFTLPAIADRNPEWIANHRDVAARIERVLGILNGTTNFVLTAMTETGASYGDALAEAQRLGYAEPDPGDDVSGRDAAAKLALLAGIADEVASAAAIGFAAAGMGASAAALATGLGVTAIAAELINTKTPVA